MFAIYVFDDVDDDTIATIENVLDASGVNYRVEDIDPARNGYGGFRRSDPATSRKAAFDALPRTDSQRREALMAIMRCQDSGATYADVQRLTGVNGVWKRISELKEGGWIEVVGQRRVSTTGSEADVYRVTLKARRMLEHA